jgi:REP-associated tyrosine transposase
MPIVHVWFATKRRRRILEGDLLDAARVHAIDLMEVDGVIDHVHLLLRLDDASTLPRAMNLLKGVSARRIFQAMPDLKHDLKTGSFWQTGYGAKLIPDGAVPQVRTYIRTQWDRLEKFEQ